MPFKDNSIDIVVSISVFEHVEFFWETYLEMLRILKPNGLLFINAPSNGHFIDTIVITGDFTLMLEKA